jgi:hypothetical protein
MLLIDENGSFFAEVSNEYCSQLSDTLTFEDKISCSFLPENHAIKMCGGRTSRLEINWSG